MLQKKRVRKSREDRISEIIAAATKIFIEEGYSELTLRRIAKDIGVRLSTIQYYFDSKKALLITMLKSKINSYNSKLSDFKSNEHKPEKQLSNYTKYLIVDNTERETCAFFTQLWAIGFQDEDNLALLSHAYEVHTENLAQMIQDIFPERDKLDSLQRATIMSSMIEGAIIHVGYGLPVRPEFEGLSERLHKEVMRIALQN